MELGTSDSVQNSLAMMPHDFVIDRRHKRPALARHMSVTGG